MNLSGDHRNTQLLNESYSFLNLGLGHFAFPSNKLRKLKVSLQVSSELWGSTSPWLGGHQCELHIKKMGNSFSQFTHLQSTFKE